MKILIKFPTRNRKTKFFKWFEFKDFLSFFKNLYLKLIENLT